MISNRTNKYKFRLLNNKLKQKICYKEKEREKEKERVEEKELYHYDNDCFICLEVYIDCSINTVKLNNMENYIKNCSCDGWLHEQCFTKWHNINKHCPICRSVIIFTKYEYYFFIFNNFKKNTRIKIAIFLRYTQVALISAIFLWWVFNYGVNMIKMNPTLSN